VRGKELVVGQAGYAVVVVPPGTRTLFRSTVALLNDLLDAGGTVIAFDPPPAMVEAEQDDAAAALFGRPQVVLLADACALQAALEAAAPRRVSICDRSGQEVSSILYLQRDARARGCFFLVNGDRQNRYRVRIGLEGVGRLQEWNALTGEIRSVPVEVRRGSVWFETSFGPADSKLYVLDRDLPPEQLSTPVGLGAAPPIPDALGPVRMPCAAYLGPVCRFKRTEPNALTLDMCRFRVGTDAFSDPMPVWQAQRAVRGALGMRPVYYNGLPQRYKWVSQPHPRDGTPVTFHFTFEVRDPPATPVHALIERAQEFKVALNGVSVPHTGDGWWLDRSFHTVPLPALRKGTNVLTLACAYRNEIEMEDVHLLGDFGVSIERAIVREPETLHFGDWCLQGYPHYPGSMIYLEALDYRPVAGQRLLLALGEHRAVTVAVHVNGEVVGHIPWQAANGFDLTDFLRDGGNQLGVEVMGSPRNMLGPLHRRRGSERGTSWASFRTEGDEYTPEYVLEPYGLYDQVRIVYAPRG
jgi:hypothetical protein